MREPREGEENKVYTHPCHFHDSLLSLPFTLLLARHLACLLLALFRYLCCNICRLFIHLCSLRSVHLLLFYPKKTLEPTRGQQIKTDQQGERPNNSLQTCTNNTQQPSPPSNMREVLARHLNTAAEPTELVLVRYCNRRSIPLKDSFI